MNILITGGSKGIGKAIAEKFAANSYTILMCARHEDELAATANEIEQNTGSKVYFKGCDISQKPSLKEFADWALSTVSAIDILVNNGGSFVPGRVHEEEDGTIEFLMETNLYSAYYLSKYITPGMMERKQGHIFNICSIASLKAYPSGGSYGITKYALAGLSANLRDELINFGVKVTSVFPGAAYTDSWRSSGIREDRFMTANDIADMIFAAAQLSPQACVEEIVIRPQLGDI